MSNAGQAILTIAGAIIGAYTGLGFIGVAYGAQLGYLAGTVLFPTQLPTVHGPRLEDLATTSVQLGTPVPIIYGTIAVPGTVIFLGCVEEVTTTEEVGGKGGPEQEVTTYSYFQTIALGLCEGPITGLLRVWENGELKYDMRPQLDGESDDDYAARIDMSTGYGAGFWLYFGDEVQEADPTLERLMGVNEVPAFRGLAYIVFPDRQLQDDQARRHPNFRFEVYRGESVQEILPPTALDGALDGYQLPFLVPDWTHNRYYAIDLTGTEGLRQFEILTNTELQQRSFEDMTAPPSSPLLFMGGTVSPFDGSIYLNWFTSGSSTTTFRFDPVTLDETSRYTQSAFVGAWDRACVVRWAGTLGSFDYLFWASTFGWLCAGFADPVAGPAVQVAHTNDSALLTNGYRQGTTAYAYALTYTGSLSESPDMDVYLLRIREVPALGIPIPIASLEIIASIPMAALDPNCVRVSRVTGLMFDATDRTLIFGAEGFDAGGDMIVQCLYKFDPSTGEIVWRSAELTIANYDEHTHESRLRGSTYVIPQPGAQLAVVDTRTGSHTLLDYLGQLPNLMTGQQLYDSGFGTVITFVIGVGPYVIFLDRRLPGSMSISTIVADVCSRCGLGAQDIDVSGLVDRTVSGYAITRPSPGRGIIEPLRSVGYFDMVESDGILKYPVRGQAIAVTLTEDDLGAHFAENDRPPLVVTKKAQDVELPKRLRLQYLAETRDYDTGDAASPTRITSSSVTELDIQIPVSITDDHARQAAEILWADAWGSRWIHEIALDVAFLGLEPTDVIAIPVDGRLYRTRIVSIDDAAGFLRRLTLVRDDDGRYTSSAVADPPQRPPVRIQIRSTTALILLDLPPLRDEDDDAGIYAVAYPSNPAGTWSGAVIHRSLDGASFAQVGAAVTAGIAGRLAEALPTGLSTTWDHENVIIVDMLSGTLESRTEAAVIGGANAAAIGVHGRWEIVQFMSATQISATRWQLSGLLRGRRATEHHIGTGQAGDLFVMLSAGGVIRLPIQIAEVGVSLIYRAVTFGTTAAESVSLPFAGNGEALRPFAPVHIHGERVGGDLLIHWTRRGRIGQELRSGADIPLSEETEAYEVDIIDPGSSPETAVRTIETTSASATYTAAEQAADGFGGGDSIMVRVYQISATVGRGTPGEAIL